MDFKSIKEKALELKKQASEKIDDAIDYSAKKLSESGLTISKKDEVDKLILKSKTTSFKNKETGEEKIYKHRSIIVFWEEKSDFFKDALIHFPVLATKAFSQNITIKLSKEKIEGFNISDLWVKEFPAIVVFEEEKVLKVIHWKENILKLVKSINLDINKEIENI